MSKQSRKTGAALRKLKRSKSAGESLRILAHLRATDPETYRAVKNS